MDSSAAIKSGGPFDTIVNLWRFRMLARTLARHHLILKYRNSLLGFVWTVLAPLGSMAVLVVVFSFVVRIPIERYWAFLLSGYFVWVFFSNVVGAATGIFRNYSPLRRSVAFPNEVVVLGVAGARLAELLAELLLIVIVLAVFHHGSLPASLIALPLLVLLLLLLVVGCAIPLATLSLLFHDIEHALPIALGLLFYLTPVFYPASMVPDAFRMVYLANPIAGLLTMFHSVLYEGAWPSVMLLGATSMSTFLILVAGWAILNRYRDVLPEVG
ncbi:MAG: ABC transporter permease [Gemmatimonadota bacterium]